MLNHIKNYFTKREEKKKLEKPKKEEDNTFNVKEEHKTHHLVLYSCNGCGSQIAPPQDERWACNECPGFDLCSNCYRSEMILVSDNKEEIEKLINSGYKPIKHYDDAPLPHLLTKEPLTQFQLVYGLRGESTFETMKKVFHHFGARPCLGLRNTIEISKEYPLGLTNYNWITYSDVYSKSILLANAITQFIDRRDFISIYMDNCVEWYLTDFASLWSGLVVVPLHHASNNQNLLEILSNSETKCISCSAESFKNLIDLYQDGKMTTTVDRPTYIKLIIHKEDQFDQSMVDKLPDGVVFKTFSEMMELGETVDPRYPFTPIGPGDLSSVAYTSGSTGVPKGVIKLDSTFNSLINNSFTQFPNSVISYNTLSHSQRLSDWRYIFQGSKIAIYSGNMNNLFSDIALVRPHSFWAVPRFWNILFAQFKNDLKEYRLANPDIDEKVATMHVYKSIRSLLGNRVSGLVTGGAPTSPEVLEFIRKCWKDINVSNSFGLTEISGVCVDGVISDEVEYKIEPVPSFGYSPTDLPNPRGELVVRSKTMSPGYYKNEQLTSESFPGGWFKTGDIVEVLGVRKIKIIDRIKHAFKLANGEFVTPEPLESHFVSLCIKQMFIYGNSLKTFLVAVVKPSDYCLQQLGLQDTPRDQLIDNSLLKSKLLQEINRIALEKKLANYEIPKIISIEFTEWNIENKLITGSGKFNRGELYKYYKDKINSMFDTIDKLQESLRNRNENGENDSNFENYIKSILNITDDNDGCNNVDEANTNNNSKINLENLSFIQIGGDSLGAIKLSTLLKEKENIDISPAVLLNQDFNLSSLSKLINEKQSNSNIVYQGDSEISKINWNDEYTLDQDIKDIIKLKLEKQQQQNSNSLIPPQQPTSSSFVKSIFITGITGYLGMYLLLNLMECKEVENIYCLVRNVKDKEETFTLIENLFKKANLNYVDSNLIKEKVIPVVGDLSKPLFGVTSETYNLLSNQVDMVIHNGAMVNMAYPYSNMRSTNVTSTRDIIRLCVSDGQSSGSKMKKLVYISTVGIFFGNDQLVDETITPSTLFLDYGNGYNQSKLVSDILVREAASLGLPSMIFRPGTIFSHTESGFNNQNDFVGLIIKGIIGSKSYPLKSDYIGGELNLSPVDWVSSSIVSIIKHSSFWDNNTTTAKIYHMVNQNILQLEQLCKFINERVPLESISYSLWKEIQLNSFDNPLYSVSPIFNKSNNRFPGGFNKIICPNTQKALESIGKLQCKPITNVIVLKYIDYLISNNLIKPIVNKNK